MLLPRHSKATSLVFHGVKDHLSSIYNSTPG
jgi:hypothetical protein